MWDVQALSRGIYIKISINRARREAVFAPLRASLSLSKGAPNRLPLHFHRKFTGLFLVFKGIVCYSIKDLDPPAKPRRHRDFPVPGSMESLFCRFDGGILP